jgi:hypothetical protein
MFNAARGSILIAVLFHYQMNLPIWPEAQPWENYLFAAVAVIVVIIERESMFAPRRACDGDPGIHYPRRSRPWTDGSGVRDYVAANSTTAPAPPTARPTPGSSALRTRPIGPRYSGRLILVSAVVQMRH